MLALDEIFAFKIIVQLFRFLSRSSEFNNTRLKDLFLLSMNFNDEENYILSSKGGFPMFKRVLL